MSKATRKGTPKKPIMSRLLSWWGDWWADFTSRVRQWGEHFFGCLGVATLAFFVLAMLLYYVVLPHYKVSIPESPETLASELQMVVVIVLLYVFVPYLILMFLLSLHPKTRPTADKLALGFLGQTELDKLKVKVERELHSTNERIDKIDERTNRTDEKLDDAVGRLKNIESKFESIETMLKSLVSKVDKGSKQ